MEIETNKILYSNFKSNSIYFKRRCYKNYLSYFIFIFLIIIILFFYNIFIIKKNYLLSFENINKLKLKIKKNNISIYNLKTNFEKFQEIMINTNKKLMQKIFKEDYIFMDEIKQQKNFCNNQILLSNLEFDKIIKKSNVEIKNKSFNLFVYKKRDYVSNEIIHLKNWELIPTNNILNALNYYSKKKKIDNNNIYIIDIGANIGWYTFSLSKFGYKIISFEPSKLNYYILKKNFCINYNSNITLINKGLYNEEKKCDLYYFNRNKGNNYLDCNKNMNLKKNMIKAGEIILTKLENYIPFIKEKNFVLIKIDVEGSEGKVFEGGVELITQYHIPFIFMEFTPSLLKFHGTDAKQFLQIFINNGYKISPNHFLDKKNYTIDYIFKIVHYQINLYITYLSVFEG